MTKNLLLTGAGGFLGQNLAPYLAALPGYKLFAPRHAELDLTQIDSLSAYLDKHKITHVIHAANLGGPRDQVDLSGVVTTNLRMFYNLVLHEGSLEKIIYFCSGAAFDKSKPIVDVAEDQVVNYLPSDDYGLSKNILARYLLARRDSKIIALRLFGVYGPHENFRLRFISNAITQNLAGQPITINRNVIFDYLPVQDLFPVVAYMLGHTPKHNIYHVTSGEKIDLIALAKIVNSVSPHPTSVQVKNLDLANEYTGSNARLTRELGAKFQVTPHAIAIKDLYAWYRTHADSLGLDVAPTG